MLISLYDRRNDPHQHGALISAQFSDGAGFTEVTEDGRLDRSAGRRVLRALFADGARCAVWHHPSVPWVVIGFAIVTRDLRVVWCWTRPRNRSRKGEPRKGVMTALLQHLGVDLSQPIVALYRSPAAEGIRDRKKLQIVFADEIQPREEHVREVPQVHEVREAARAQR